MFEIDGGTDKDGSWYQRLAKVVFLIWGLSSPSSTTPRPLEARMNRNIAFPGVISITLTQPNHVSVLRGPKAVFLPRGLGSCSRLSIHRFHDVLLSNGLPSSSSRKVIVNLLRRLRLRRRSRNSEASVPSTRWKMKVARVVILILFMSMKWRLRKMTQ